MQFVSRDTIQGLMVIKHLKNLGNFSIIEAKTLGRFDNITICSGTASGRGWPGQARP